MNDLKEVLKLDLNKISIYEINEENSLKREFSCKFNLK